MRRIVIAAAALAGLAVLAFLLWPAGDEAVAESPTSIATREGAAPEFAPKPETMNALLSKPVRAEGGAGTIRGKVVNAGQPVAGATVTATRVEAGESLSELGCHCDNACGQKLLECGCGEASEQIKELVAERRGEVVPVGRTVTGADGTFELTHLEPGTVALWSDRDPMGTALVRDVPVGGADVVVALGTGVRLSGKVTLDGKPAGSGAWITAINVEQSRFFDLLAQSDGMFALGPLPVGRYSIIGGAPGALSGHLHVRKDTPTERLELTLYSPRTVKARVELDGKPVAGVKVIAEGNHRTREAVSGGDGVVAFDGLRPGSYELSATKGPLRADAMVRIPRQGVAKDAVLVLAKSAFLSVTVRAAGAPIAGARLGLFSMGKSAEGTTDADGRADLQVFSGKGANVSVSAKGYVDHRENVDLVAGETTSVAVALEPVVFISGRVLTPDGEPIDGADVGARPDAPKPPKEEDAFSIGDDDDRDAFVKTFDGGYFVLENLKRGSYDVTASHSDHRPAEAKAQAPSDGVVLTLKAGLVLDGEVADATGKPAVAKVEVWVEDARRQPVHTAESGADGKFKVRGLSEGKQWARARGAAGKVTQAVTIGPRGNFVRLVLEPLFSISGTVTTVDATPVPDVIVFARGDEGRGSGHSDAVGAFEIKDLKEGEYHLEAFSRTHALVEPVKAKAGARGVVLKVRPQLKVRGRVVDDKGVPISKFTVDYEPIEAEDGRFEVDQRSFLGKTAGVRISVEGHPEVRKKGEPRDGVIDLGDVVFGGRSVRVRTMKGTAPLKDSDLWRATDWSTPGSSPLTVTGDDGWATLHGLPTQNAVIVANHPTHRPKHVPLADGQSEVVVAMEPGGTLAVKTVDAAGAPVQAVLHVQIPGDGHHLTVTTSKAGVARLEGMSAGPATLIASRYVDRYTQSNERAVRTVDVPESGELPVALTLAKGTVALTLNVARPPGTWDAVWTVLAAPGAVPPTSTPAYQAIAAAGEAERASTAGVVSYAGTTPGRRLLFVLFQDDASRRVAYFTVPLEIGPEASQQRTIPAPAPTALTWITPDEP